MKILIVEDEPIPAAYLTKILQSEGYHIVGTATKGQDAIEMVKNKKPDIILMDIMLEDNISGSEVAIEITKDNPDICIIFLTAYSDKEMVSYAVEAQAFSYLLKPYREKEILATLALATTQLERQRNTNTVCASLVFLSGEYVYDINQKILFNPVKDVDIGPKALELIHLLCSNSQQTFQTETILTILWDNSISEQALRSLVYRIREATTPALIINKNKTGYRIGLLEQNTR